MLVDKSEAVWAGIVDWRYVSVMPLPSQEAWQGPMRGPLWAAANWLDRMVDLLKRRQFASPETVGLSQLLLYVVSKPVSIKDWRRFAIKRLTTMYPADPNQRLGSPIPREALDPDTKYDASTAPALINAFSRGLSPARNPFLATPSAMFAGGFAERPYVFP
jgi:hypothetical protein